MLKAAKEDPESFKEEDGKWKVENKFSTSNFYRILKRFFVHVRRCQMGPLKWYRSDGFESAKGKANKEILAEHWRWLHLMDPWGSAWHATILASPKDNNTTEGAQEPTDYTHAYLAHRSREAPIAVNEITSYRLKQAGVSFVRNQYDGKNVLPSIGRNTLLEQIPQMIKKERKMR